MPRSRIGRVDVEFDPSNVSRPRVFLSDPCDGEIWVCFNWGQRWADPAFRFDVRLDGAAARPFIWLADRMWDRKIRRSERNRRG